MRRICRVASATTRRRPQTLFGRGTHPALLPCSQQFRPYRLFCDDAARREAALNAIANAQRSAGEIEAAEKAAADLPTTVDGSPHVEADQSVFDLLGNPIEGPPRFPLGASVECRLGEGKWLGGRVIGHFYRERSWPNNRRAPYQVQVDDGGPTIFAPADVDECIRTTLRFGVSSVVECYLGSERGWVLGVVTKQYHRELSWEPGKWVPYQVDRLNIDLSADALALLSQG